MFVAMFVYGRSGSFTDLVIIVSQSAETRLFEDSLGPGCSKLTMLVNVPLKFQTFVSEIIQYFLSKNVRMQKLLSFFQYKISLYLVIKW